MRTMLLATMVIGLMASQARAQGKAKPASTATQPPASSAAQPQTDDEKTLYSFGYNYGKSLTLLGMSPSELELFKRGLTEGNTGAPPAVDVDRYGAPRAMQALTQGRQDKANEAFLQRAAQEKGAVKLPSGVVYKEVKAGTGPSPKSTDTVGVNYRGTLISGDEFDSSYKHGQIAEFPLNGVIPCWTEGIQKMKVGGQARLVCPAKTAYGDRPPPSSKIIPNSVLVFDVELVSLPGDTSKH
ncbi:MAG: FKBP-type peptidyl-prolyl cis-trans isomerase [Hyalangium sp.]|uniref:FKBP-type peptidyl-prolyl cis-trans isomerase n=1 Tax=Hyalangium sp. TaxID=2028555 RepID=UPI00389ACAC7